MAGHSDVFPVKSYNTKCDALSPWYVAVHAIRKITSFNGQITVILRENGLKQYIKQEATYQPYLFKSARKGILTVFNGQMTYFLFENGLKQEGKQKATTHQI